MHFKLTDFIVPLQNCIIYKRWNIVIKYIQWCKSTVRKKVKEKFRITWLKNKKRICWNKIRGENVALKFTCLYSFKYDNIKATDTNWRITNYNVGSKNCDICIWYAMRVEAHSKHFGFFKRYWAGINRHRESPHKLDSLCIWIFLLYWWLYECKYVVFILVNN